MQETPQFSMVPGFKFRPTDAELVGYYLINKILKKPVLYDGLIIKNCDIYGQEEPWDTWNRFEVDDDDGLYFFTRLKRKTPNGSRIDRKVGSHQSTGTWHGENSGFQFQIKIKVNGTKNACITACKKRFSYRNPKSDQHGRWIMNEYSCSLSDDIVVCHLRKIGTAAHIPNNMTARVKPNSSKKRKLSEFQQDAMVDQIEPTIAIDDGPSQFNHSNSSTAPCPCPVCLLCRHNAIHMIPNAINTQDAGFLTLNDSD